MITGRDLINEYYESEKLYSTGDEDLDDLLERAFCEGYEYAQREFGKLDKDSIIREAKKKGKSLKKSEITLEMLRKFREDRKAETTKKLFEVDKDSLSKTFKQKINGRINRKAIEGPDNHFNHSASAGTLREGTNLPSLGGTTADFEGARAKKYKKSRLYNHGGSIDTMEEFYPNRVPKPAEYIKELIWQYK